MKLVQMKRGFYAGMVLLIGVILLQVKIQRDLLTTSDMVYRNHAKSEALDELFITVLNIETGVRGYALTKDKRFLAPYTEANQTLDYQLEELSELAADDPKLRVPFEELKALITLRKQQATDTIDHVGAREDALQRISAAKATMDLLRAKIDSLEKNQIDKRMQAVAENRRYSSLMVRISTITALIVIIFLIFSSRRLTHEMERRAKSEYNLKLSLGSLKTLTSSIPTGIMAFDNKGLITFTNQRASELLTFNPDKVLGTSFLALAGWEQEPPAGVLRAIKHGDSFDEEITLGHKGQRFPARLRLSPLFERSEFVGTVASFQDISLEHDLREDLENQKRSAIVESKAKSEFLSKMSHEFRTPLNAIIGMADTLARSGLSGEQQKYATVLNSAAESLLRLINDVLDLSKIEAGKLELEHAPFNLHDTIAEVVKMMSYRASEKGVILKFDSGLKNQSYAGDSLRVYQIVVNLLSNALKFTEAGSVSVVAQEVGDVITVEVIDTGKGIDRDKLESIFEQYAQENAHIAATYGGTGLGLSISRELARRMGGDLVAHSEAGKGSRFILTLKLEKRAVHDAPSATQAISLAPLRMLLVDDNPDNRLVIKSYLKDQPVTITEAEDGLQAIDAAAAAAFDVIFMDMHMPRLDGYAATRAIRQSGNQTPIIALTAYALNDEIQTMLEAGCRDRLVKPVSRQKLLAYLQAFQAETKAHAASAALELDDDIRALVPGYLERKRQELPLLREALATNDAAYLKKLSHNLKGTALSYGQTELDEWAKLLSAAVDAADWERIRVLARVYEDILTTTT